MSLDISVGIVTAYGLERRVRFQASEQEFFCSKASRLATQCLLGGGCFPECKAAWP
jgi:hypothetical protein